MALTLHLHQTHVTAHARMELTRAAATTPFPGDAVASVLIEDERGMRTQHMHPGEMFRAGDQLFILRDVDASVPGQPSCSFCAWA
jgi:hypothetical protein